MDEYISKRAAYFALKNEADTHELPASKEAYERAARIIDQITPEDVQPVKHGRWEKLAIVPATDTGNRILARCTECEDTMLYTTMGREITLKYCTNCGARMDRGEEDENNG